MVNSDMSIKAEHQMKSSTFSEEFLFVTYFWGSTLLRPLLQRYSNNSTIIMFVFALVLVIFLLLKLLKNRYISIRPLVLIIITLMVLMLDMLIRPSIYTGQYLYEFIISGAITVLFLSQIKRPIKLLKIYAIVSLVAFIFYGWDPLNEYAIFTNDMTFGFDLAVPAYIGIYLGRRFFKYRWWIVAEIICLFEIAIFANRSSILNIVVFWILIEVLIIKKKIVFKSIVFATSSIIVLILLPDIVSWIYNIILSKGFSSYSLFKLQTFFETKSLQDLFSGRLSIWEYAFAMMKENILLGHGTAAFHATYGFYTHNILFDIVIQYGILGFFLIVGLIINTFKRINKHDIDIKLCGILFFGLWFPKLFFSIYFFKDKGFWCFIAFGLMYFKRFICDKESLQLNKKIKL